MEAVHVDDSEMLSYQSDWPHGLKHAEFGTGQKSL